MGVLSFVSLALFAIGSFAAHDPKSTANEDNFVAGKKWVVLVAGSEGWENYGHQADICHAYQIVKENGIPKENIITMMVDDIAYNSKNPTPGKIFNKLNGSDVYHGVSIDYKGKDVNKSNFINIITGNKAGMRGIGSGKVVEGGPHDRIFINFADHGMKGALIFPHEFLFADELNDAFTTMKYNGSYRKMLLYIEACDAGSMFANILGEDTNIFAVTASGPKEYSWAAYCPFESDPLNQCRGDLFSVTWMEALEQPSSIRSKRKRTIFNHFRVVRSDVTLSNVMIYGDLDTGREKLSSFIGYSRNGYGDSHVVQQSDEHNLKNTVSSRDMYDRNIKYKLANDTLSLPESLKLSAELRQNNKMRSVIDSILRGIYSEVVKARPDIKSEVGDYDKPNHLQLNLAMFPCYRSFLNQISESCFSLPRNPYVWDHLKVFANLCVVDNQIHQMVGSIVAKSCSNIPKNIIKIQ